MYEGLYGLLVHRYLQRYRRIPDATTDGLLSDTHASSQLPQLREGVLLFLLGILLVHVMVMEED